MRNLLSFVIMSAPPTSQTNERPLSLSERTNNCLKQRRSRGRQMVFLAHQFAAEECILEQQEKEEASKEESDCSLNSTELEDEDDATPSVSKAHKRALKSADNCVMFQCKHRER